MPKKKKSGKKRIARIRPGQIADLTQAVRSNNEAVYVQVDAQNRLAEAQERANLLQKKAADESSKLWRKSILAAFISAALLALGLLINYFK